MKKENMENFKLWDRLVLLAGNANKDLSEKIAKKLDKPLSDAIIKKFSDGEIWVEIKENVRGREIFVLQPTCPPVNENLMELLIILDALNRSSASKITAVIPYYGYARQDRKTAARTPISAKLVANLLSKAGATRILTMDLHAGQIQGFFDIPVDNLYSAPVLVPYIKEKYRDDDIVIVSPDAGGVERARAFAKRLDSDLAIIDKRRPGPNEAEIMNIVGDIKGKTAIIVDDMVDTAGTLTKAVDALLKNGAKKVSAAITHPVLSGKAYERISSSKLHELIVTDTIPIREEFKSLDNITIISVSEIFGEAIKRIYYETSVSSLFE